eukprot:876661-Pleurochrysis_carterae.AAC.1
MSHARRDLARLSPPPTLHTREPEQTHCHYSCLSAFTVADRTPAVGGQASSRTEAPPSKKSSETRWVLDGASQ